MRATSHLARRAPRKKSPGSRPPQDRALLPSAATKPILEHRSNAEIIDFPSCGTFSQWSARPDQRRVLHADPMQSRKRCPDAFLGCSSGRFPRYFPSGKRCGETFCSAGSPSRCSALRPLLPGVPDDRCLGVVRWRGSARRNVALAPASWCCTSGPRHRPAHVRVADESLPSTSTSPTSGKPSTTTPPGAPPSKSPHSSPAAASTPTTRTPSTPPSAPSTPNDSPGNSPSTLPSTTIDNCSVPGD